MIKYLFKELDLMDHQMKMGYDFDKTSKLFTKDLDMLIQKQALDDSRFKSQKNSINTEFYQDFVFSTLSSSMIYSPFVCSRSMNGVNSYRDTNIEALNIQMQIT